MQLSIGRLRRRLPLAVFILLLLLLVVCVGFAFACTSDHPGQAIEQALATLQPAAVVELWSVGILGLLLPAVYAGARRRAAVARSPAMLQCLLL